VVVGHSFGGAAALDVLSQSCLAAEARSVAGLSFCEAYQPPVRSSSSSSSSGAPASCKELNPAAGRTAAEAGGQQQQQQKGVILGAIVFEGYKVRQDTAAAGPAAPTAAARSNVSAAAAAPARSGDPSLNPAGVVIPPGTFLLFVAGQYGAPKTTEAYDRSNASSCSCIGHADFAGLNHYGINNWQGEGSHQMTPCGRKASSDPANFNVSNSFQDAQLLKMAELMDEFIRASLGDAAAQQRLMQQAAAGGAVASSRSSRVRARMMLSGTGAAGIGGGVGVMQQQQQQQPPPSVGYSLQLKKQCFV
jgi:hypothetical protein